MIAATDAKLEKAGFPGGLRGADWVGVKLMALIAFAIGGFLLGLLLTRGSFAPVAALRRLRGQCSATWLLSSGSVARSAREAWP